MIAPVPIVPDPPEQKVMSFPAFAVGTGRTITCTVSLSPQPKVFDNTITYCKVSGTEFPLVSEITGFEMLPLLNPVAGVHVYVYPAVGKLPKGALVPEQIETLLPAFATGKGLVVTTIVSLFVHPFKEVVKM